MKRHFSVVLAMLSILAMFPTNAFAAAGSKKVALSSIEYQQGGIVLLFETSGLSKADLRNNSFYADSNFQKMSCNFVDHTTTVRCVVSRALAGHGNFRATLAGFAFWGEIPEPRFRCEGGEIAWYSIDVYQNGELVDSGELPVWIWKEFVSLGILDDAASEGVTFDITNTFCGPDFEIPS
jgi:hypothetical protein